MVSVTFLHPDLGIGGAERLVVDAALALKSKGHKVNIVTTHHDPKHAFSETTDGTIPVIVVGDWLPRHVFGKLFALCAYLRMTYAAICIYFLGLEPDMVFCDLVSVCIPILRLFVSQVIFYCHHPDQLLTDSKGRWKSLYRMPLNYLEEVTTGKADKIFVNSIYTQIVFKKTFKTLEVEPEVLYPSINTKFFDETQSINLSEVLDGDLPEGAIVLLSINRYERKKNLSLAIQALADLGKVLDTDVYNKVYLVMAGGYDKRVDENVEHHLELVQLVDQLDLNDKVIFLKSPSDVAKVSLLVNCTLLIYTPINEHFGIVPLEAMYCKKPVIAQNSGGPTESIVDGQTGYLVGPSSKEIADRIAMLLNNKQLLISFGEAGYKRFCETFSFQAFTKKLHTAVYNLSMGTIIRQLNANMDKTMGQFKTAMNNL
ncbi:alpha-1,3/1,6-mannosyltransferase ALG2 [Venturia canescens]|uniref:alpha-1,3/1,6-mannosyltransferase ALG2 n=1 Tax=Venturia canescens TaxID=32260 RepID=UPI001C9BDE66|nr:alpha-1,3/1,6-mannosyltransferase ALG2 [Venturia canescens]